MKFFRNVLFVVLAITARVFSNEDCKLATTGSVIPQNNCVSFSVTSGTGCAWMCNYCANTLGTNNYYFTSGVCTYQTGGCVGNPQTGVTYTCCSV